VLELWDGTRKSDKIYLLTQTYIKPTNKLINTLFGTPLVLGQATGDSGLTRFTKPGLKGSHYLPPYIILCASPRHLHPNGFLSWDSQGRVSKLSRFGLLGLCEVIILCSNLWLGQSLKKTCSSPQELSNGVLHSTCTHQSWVDSRLLMVGSQTASLTPDPSFCHNMCCRCSNGPCKPIFDIYTLIPFQWYREHLNARCFDPCNRTLKFWDSQVPISRVWVSSSHSLNVGSWHWPTIGC